MPFSLQTNYITEGSDENSGMGSGVFRAVVAETSVRRLPPSHDAARLSCPLKRCNSFR